MKLQPNFSWQKYEGAREDQKEQFQYQLQTQHIQVANSVNATIDDESFFTRERQTAFTWVNNKPIYTKTLPVNQGITNNWAGAGTSCVIPTGITGPFTVVNMVCCLSDGALSSSNTVLLPHLDAAYGTGSISIVRNGTNIVLSTSGLDRSAYSGYVTVYFYKEE